MKETEIIQIILGIVTLSVVMGFTDIIGLNAEAFGKIALVCTGLFARPGDAHEFLIAGAKHLRHGTFSHLQTRVVNRRQILRFPEYRRKPCRFPPRLADLTQFVETDPPAHDRKPDQDIKHELDDRSRVHCHGVALPAAGRNLQWRPWPWIIRW